MQYGVNASATAVLAASFAILDAEEPVSQPPQLNPTIAKIIAPATAPQGADPVHSGSFTDKSNLYEKCTLDNLLYDQPNRIL